MKAKVSVIMPVYNAEKYINKAINSILDQSYTNLELILINDCPTDSSMKIVNSYKDDRIHIINNSKNMGIAYSRNIGLQYSSGKYIALMDDDDISISSRLETQVNFLEKRDDIDIVGGMCEIIDEEDNVIKQTSGALFNPKYIRAVYLFKNAYYNGSVMMRKDIIKNNNISYKNDCFGMEDFRFWIECSKLCNMSNINEILIKYRSRTDNESSRVYREQSVERKKMYADLQRFSLYESGFRLSEDMLKMINKVMAETNGKCNNLDEAKQFHLALREIVNQSRKMECDNCDEIMILCKKILGEKIAKMDCLWESI